MFDDPALEKLRATIRAASHYQEPHDMKTLESIARAAKIEPSAVKAAATLAGVQPSEFVAGVAHYDAAAQITILETLTAGRKASATAERSQREAKAQKTRPATLRQIANAVDSVVGLHDAPGFSPDMIARAYAASEGRQLEDDIQHVLDNSEERDDRRQRQMGVKNIAFNMAGNACRAHGKKTLSR